MDITNLKKTANARVLWWPVALITACAGLVALTLLHFQNTENTLINTVLVLSLGISLIAALVVNWIVTSMLIGLLFGLLIGFVHAATLTELSQHHTALSINIVSSLFFTTVGIVIGSSLILVRKIFYFLKRRRIKRARSVSPGGPSTEGKEDVPDPLGSPISEFVTYTAFAVSLGALISAVIFSTVPEDAVALYLTLGFTLLVAVVSMFLTNIRFFSWISGIIGGYFFAALIIAVTNVAPLIHRQFYDSIQGAFYFMLLGFVIGVAAELIIVLHHVMHKIVHGNAAEPYPKPDWHGSLIWLLRPLHFILHAVFHDLKRKRGPDERPSQESAVLPAHGLPPRTPSD